MDAGVWRAVLERLYGFGEAPAGSEAEHELAEAIASLSESFLDVSARLLPVRVYRWEPGEATIEACGGVFEAVLQPPSPGASVEGRVGEEIAVIDARGLGADEVHHRYWLAAAHGAEAVIILYDVPRRVVVTPSPPVPGAATEPAPAAVGVSGRDAERLLSCGGRLRVEAWSRAGPGTGFIVEAVPENPGVVYTAHHDHWFRGASDNLVGVVQALAAAAVSGGGFVSFTGEELGSWPLEAWYWAWGSRLYSRLVDWRGSTLIVNFDMAVGNVGVMGSPYAGRCLARLAGLGFNGRDDTDFDSYSFTSLGAAAVTVAAAEEPPWYHSIGDTLDKVNVEDALALARRVAEAAQRARSALAACASEYLAGLMRAYASRPLPLSRSRLYKLIRLADKRRAWVEAAGLAQEASTLPVIAAGRSVWSVLLGEAPEPPPPVTGCPGLAAAGGRILWVCGGGAPSSTTVWRLLDRLAADRLEEAYERLYSEGGGR